VKCGGVSPAVFFMEAIMDDHIKIIVLDTFYYEEANVWNALNHCEDKGFIIDKTLILDILNELQQQKLIKEYVTGNTINLHEVDQDFVNEDIWFSITDSGIDELIKSNLRSNRPPKNFD
jgi:hypothetical protein